MEPVSKYEITPTPLSKQLQFAREHLRVSRYHLETATTPGMKQYWGNMVESHQRRVLQLEEHIRIEDAGQ